MISEYFIEKNNVEVGVLAANLQNTVPYFVDKRMQLVEDHSIV